MNVFDIWIIEYGIFVHDVDFVYVFCGGFVHDLYYGEFGFVG